MKGQTFFIRYLFKNLRRYIAHWAQRQSNQIERHKAYQFLFFQVPTVPFYSWNLSEIPDQTPGGFLAICSVLPSEHSHLSEKNICNSTNSAMVYRFLRADFTFGVALGLLSQ